MRAKIPRPRDFGVRRLYIRIVSTNACANFLRKPAAFGRGSAGFRGKIARWLKTAVYQSYVGDHAVKQAFNSMSPSLVLFLQYGLLLIIAFRNGVCDEHEYRLTKHLLDGYDAGVRPAKNSSQPLVVVFGLSLHHIIDVDEKNQILTTNCWVTQIWTDHHLKWNASEFAGIRVIRVPYNRVWRPDTILYNNADPQYSSAVINTNVIVSHTGQVVWLSHGIFRSSCDINVEFFPFDEQRCALKWASWTYDGYQLELESQSEQGDVSNYQANGEFHLLDFTARRNVEYYSCCQEPYPDITYEIRLRRRPMFYVFNLILPCILINGVALLVFYVPSESGEKVTLGISALLSMTVFLMTIRETLPPTEKTPLIKCDCNFRSSIIAARYPFLIKKLAGKCTWDFLETRLTVYKNQHRLISANVAFKGKRSVFKT